MKEFCCGIVEAHWFEPWMIGPGTSYKVTRLRRKLDVISEVERLNRV